MINLSEPSAEKAKQAMSMQAFFSFAFRPLFLFGALFSIISLLLWSQALTGSIQLQVYGGMFWWHMHEMLFAFVTAIIIGFLLTAVQNWTGVRSLNGRGLMVLVGIWLLARVVMFFPTLVPLWLIALLDMLFLPIAAIALAMPIIKVKLWRNILFIPILLIMTVCNGMMHYSVLAQAPEILTGATTFMVLLVTLIMCIMGGRVFPMFTANGTKTPRVPALAWLEKASMVSIIIAVISGSGVLPLPAEFIAIVFIVSGLLHAFRVFRWKFSVTLQTPLVWSLHISYWALSVGLVMFGLAKITSVVSISQAIHTLTVGAMGTMILAMISRVSLGHTGRNIIVGKVMTFAFISIVAALITRVFAHYVISDYNLVIQLSVLLWVVAYGCFVALYLPILTRPRADA